MRFSRIHGKYYNQDYVTVVGTGKDEPCVVDDPYVFIAMLDGEKYRVYPTEGQTMDDLLTQVLARLEARVCE